MPPKRKRLQSSGVESVDTPYSNANHLANGSHKGKRPLVPGIYVPTVVFFQPKTEDLDIPTLKRHIHWLAQSGISGIAVQGSNGEAVHLGQQERTDVTRATREALDEAGFTSLPVIVGTGAQSTREAIALARDGAQAGGDYILVLPPSYYKANVSKRSLMQYFTDIADASPLPLLIYNFPAVAGGIDLSAEDINLLAQHSNIIGVKLTCGNVGKLQRITRKNVCATHESKDAGFMAMGGLADFTIPMMVAGGSGIITGLGNIAPKACVNVFNLYANGERDEARKAQALVADGDWGVIIGGVPGCKSAMQTYYGYGGVGRRPLAEPTPDEVKMYAELFKEVVEYEKSL